MAPVQTSSLTQSAIDQTVIHNLSRQGATLRPPCDDYTFARRVRLDVTGKLPALTEIDAFVKDGRADKRSRLIDKLLSEDAYADYWSMKWCDLLRVKSEFPINLWPNGVQAYHRWIHNALRTDMPYDRMAREMVASSGSNFRVPPVNFLRATPGRDPETLARMFALTFLGQRMETWPAVPRKQLAAFFDRVAYKSTREWKEEIIYPDPQKTGPFTGVLPDGTRVSLPAYSEPRESLAKWLTAPSNKQFTSNIVNRIWYWLMGYGPVHEPDDWRVDNPCACGELIDVLNQELVHAGFRLKPVYRAILNSQTYQQASVCAAPSRAASDRFAQYTIRPLEAEVLQDALNRLAGRGIEYVSPIPEPFTHVPPTQPTVLLDDGSITSSFLTLFGRPARDTGLLSERTQIPTAEQRRRLLNSQEIHRKLVNSPFLRSLIRGNSVTPQAVNRLYLFLMCRPPETQERDVVLRYVASSNLSPRDALVDLAWALINTGEFLCRH